MSSLVTEYFTKTFKIFLSSRFVRFLIVGGINTLFGYLMYAVFIFFDFHYSIAALAATTLGVLFNFKTTGKLVFGSNNNKLIFKFIRVYIFLYVVNVMVLKVLHSQNFDMYVAGALLLPPMATISFLLNKKLVFRG